jgi:PAS domain S-box-containing protein
VFSANEVSIMTPSSPVALDIDRRLSRQRDALLALTSSRHYDCDALPQNLSRILEVSARTLDVGRASIWRYTDARDGIRSMDLFDAVSGRHTSGEEVSASDYPRYFEALAKLEIIAANDACRDPQTSEFTAAYLVPLGITSMMDVPIHQNGAVIGVLCHEHTGEMRRWTDDEKTFAIGVANLISLAFERCERSRAEAAVLLKSAALDAAGQAMLITDAQRRIVWANPAFNALTGYAADEVLGRDPVALLRAEMTDETVYQSMLRTLDEGRVWRGEMLNRRKDGTTVLIEQTVTPVRNSDGVVTHFVSIRRDLTDQRRLEAQFLQAQKMEVVGRLAGGIAHDFNNLLTVINGTAELAIEDLSQHHPLRADLERIHESGKRAASLTRQLLAFSRKQLIVHEPLVIAQVLDEFRGILQRLIGEDITLDVAAESGTAAVIADRSQIEQVILNLAVNARDAMPQGGRLRVAATVEPRRTDAAETAPHIRLSFSDTGAGMSAEVQARIFEPFFTTKEAGKGTGLGLATVYAIVEQSAGSITVTSGIGQGTTFDIYLPCAEQGGTLAAAEPRQQLAHGRETVLVVEDDDPVRELAARVLKSAGYVVLAAAEADEALRLFDEHRDAIDLILTDVVMPGMGGRDLANRTTAMRPGVPILFTSGHTDDAVLAHGVREQTARFLAKPYSPAALAQKVRETLDQARRR